MSSLPFRIYDGDEGRPLHERAWMHLQTRLARLLRCFYPGAAYDTDGDWRDIAARQPFFGVLTDDRFRTENLSDAVVEEFYASGRSEVAAIVQRIEALERPFRPERALDFGCGVGRLTLAMAAYARDVTGVDIAPAMIELAKQRQRQQGVDNVRFLTNGFDEPVDWVNSFIVLQHIVPARGYKIIAGLLRQLRPGGAVSLHVTTHRAPEPFWRVFESSVLIPAKGVIGMYDYDLNRIAYLLARNGIETVRMDMTQHGKHSGVWITGIKRSAG
ncbi:MAG TPA: class I SAM-dependent methyltransferase [Bryobacteraceae bacterium]|nr:class I SAM-dependent methyltransferase [Bryobacteraceae bacterium]